MTSRMAWMQDTRAASDSNRKMLDTAVICQPFPGQKFCDVHSARVPRVLRCVHLLARDSDFHATNNAGMDEML